MSKNPGDISLPPYLSDAFAAYIHAANAAICSLIATQRNYSLLQFFNPTILPVEPNFSMIHDRSLMIPIIMMVEGWYDGDETEYCHRYNVVDRSVIWMMVRRWKAGEKWKDTRLEWSIGIWNPTNGTLILGTDQSEWKREKRFWSALPEKYCMK